MPQSVPGRGSDPAVDPRFRVTTRPKPSASRLCATRFSACDRPGSGSTRRWPGVDESSDATQTAVTPAGLPGPRVQRPRRSEACSTDRCGRSVRSRKADTQLPSTVHDSVTVSRAQPHQSTGSAASHRARMLSKSSQRSDCVVEDMLAWQNSHTPPDSPLLDLCQITPNAGNANGRSGGTAANLKFHELRDNLREAVVWNRQRASWNPFLRRWL